MTAAYKAPLRFNAMRDPWLPLLEGSGTATWASPVEVLSGEKDGIDLDYPRDDFRFYARLLLSALVQALFPAETKARLKQRLQNPMRRSDVEARIRPVLSEFDLFGPSPFLQIVPPDNAPKDGGAARFVFGEPDLYQPAIRVDAVSLPIALVMLFIEQTYAGGAGRGYGAGPGGQPGAFTLVDPGSVRTSAWANTLTLEWAKRNYAPDTDRPWSSAKRAARPRASIGLVDGLFFQPRAVWLIPAGEGKCTFTGVESTLVRLSPLLAKSEVEKKPSKGEDIWQHPCAPLVVNSQGIGAVRLDAERPAWTGLAQLLDPLSKSKTKAAHPLEGPAPVLKQWKTLGYKTKPRLLVLDFVRDKANVKRRFFEAYPLTDDLLESPDPVERLRHLVRGSQSIERALVYALTRAHDERKSGGFALPDARSSFWSATEAPFLAWLDAITGIDGATEVAAERANRVQAEMLYALRKAALAIFDAHAALSEFDPRKQECVAKARSKLCQELWCGPKQGKRPQR
jgi:CRISPR type I-E-associated protein CasA/Cse1